MDMKFACLSVMLRMLFLSFYSAEGTFTINSKTGIILNDHSWIVLKEDIFIPVNATEVKVIETSSESPTPVKYVKKTILNNVKNNPEMRNDTSQKDPSLQTCRNVTLKVGEYTINDNGTLHVKAFRLTLNSSLYIQKGDLVTICKPMKKDVELSTFAKIVLGFLTFAYSLITLLSAMCSFSKNSTYLKLALVSWICVSSNIFLWIIVILIIPGPQSLFSWVSMCVNMNQSVYLTSAWMALLTSERVIRFLQDYSLIEISKRVVTIKVGSFGFLCVILATAFAVLNAVFDKVLFVENQALFDCMFCNPMIYIILGLTVLFESMNTLCKKDHTAVGRDYQSHHLTLCKFCVFNFYCIFIGTIAVVFEWHFFLWVYTLFNFIWPLFFLRNIIPRLQTLMALASEDDDEIDEKFLIPSTKLIPYKKGEDLGV